MRVVGPANRPARGSRRSIEDDWCRTGAGALRRRNAPDQPVIRWRAELETGEIQSERLSATSRHVIESSIPLLRIRHDNNALAQRTMIGGLYFSILADFRFGTGLAAHRPANVSHDPQRACDICV
jgi:hypothetical protein